MRSHYEFSKARPNPYARLLKKQITLRLDEPTVAYFKGLAQETPIPYQTLINPTCVSAQRPGSSSTWPGSRRSRRAGPTPACPGLAPLAADARRERPEVSPVTTVLAAGIDLSGPSSPRKSCVVVLRCRKNSAVFVESLPVAGDSEIYVRIRDLSRDTPLVVGFVAPLLYQPGGGLRARDRSLRERIVEQGMRHGSVCRRRSIGCVPIAWSRSRASPRHARFSARADH